MSNNLFIPYHTELASKQYLSCTLQFTQNHRFFNFWCVQAFSILSISAEFFEQLKNPTTFRKRNQILRDFIFNISMKWNSGEVCHPLFNALRKEYLLMINWKFIRIFTMEKVKRPQKLQSIEKNSTNDGNHVIFLLYFFRLPPLH